MHGQVCKKREKVGIIFNRPTLMLRPWPVKMKVKEAGQKNVNKEKITGR